MFVNSGLGDEVEVFTRYPTIIIKSKSAIILQEDDVYVSKCPELEVASTGDTPEEALENLKEAVELYL